MELPKKSNLSKEDLRRLMKEKSAKKIDSPFAKYDNNNQLFCILCKAQVKNDASWTAHVNGRQHHQNLASQKAVPVPKQSSSASVDKRTVSRDVAAEVSISKPKHGSLIPATKDLTLSDNSPKIKENPVKKQKILDINYLDDVDMETSKGNPLPSDFFDSSTSVIPPDTKASTVVPEATRKEDSLPDDFFDKPNKNLKQKMEREKQKQEEDEWVKFQKAINEESHKSAIAVEQEDEEARRQRELEDIEEQLARWEKIHQLEIKKEQAKVKSTTPMEISTDESKKDGNSDEEDDDDLQFMNWRKRKLW